MNSFEHVYVCARYLRLLKRGCVRWSEGAAESERARERARVEESARKREFEIVCVR